MEDIFLKLMFNTQKNCMSFYNDLHFFPEKMKLEKIDKLVRILHDKEEYVIHIRNLKQTLNHGLVLKI